VTETPEPTPGQVRVGDALYMVDAKGSLIPIEIVRKQDFLQDQLVRALFVDALELSKRIAGWKVDTFAEIDTFVELINGHYGAKAGGAKGNLTLSTFDGCIKFQVQVSDQQRFGPELQAAKTLVDECLNDWTEGSRAELRAIVSQAFDVDKEGLINRGRLFGLLRYEIDDERWKRAMQAIRDSIVIEGSKRYVRIYHRDSPKGAWQPLSLDAATA
jgi:hypothetical protein